MARGKIGIFEFGQTVIGELWIIKVANNVFRLVNGR